MSTSKQKIISRKQFLKDVHAEATGLRDNLTDEEKGRILHDKLDPNKRNKCIYGQATGDCSSDRAKTLMDICCKRQFDFSSLSSGGINNMLNENYSSIKSYINGKYNAKTWNSRNSFRRRNYSYVSVLEGYIAMKGARNKSLISYIKGDIDTWIPKIY